MNLQFRSRKRPRKRDVARKHAPKALIAGAAAAVVAAAARIIGGRRRKTADDATTVPVDSGTAAVPDVDDRTEDDVTLARRVESEVFLPADGPKGDVAVNAHDGVVELSGTVASSERSAALAAAAAKVEGVDEVRNLLKVGGSDEG